MYWLRRLGEKLHPLSCNFSIRPDIQFIEARSTSSFIRSPLCPFVVENLLQQVIARRILVTADRYQRLKSGLILLIS